MFVVAGNSYVLYYLTLWVLFNKVHFCRVAFHCRWFDGAVVVAGCECSENPVLWTKSFATQCQFIWRYCYRYCYFAVLWLLLLLCSYFDAVVVVALISAAVARTHKLRIKSNWRGALADGVGISVERYNWEEKDFMFYFESFYKHL